MSSGLQFDLNPLKGTFTFNAEKHLQSIKHNLMNGFQGSAGSQSNTSSKMVKDRSIYGQPKVHHSSDRRSTTSSVTWRSLDSLSAPDSGTFFLSTSASASTSTSDIRSRFETNASDLGTSVETSEDEADTYKRHERQPSSLTSSQISTGSDAFEVELDDKDTASDKQEFDRDVDDYEGRAKRFMKQFVEKIFESSSDISLESKAMFGEFARSLTGRLWFARYINEQRNRSKQVCESTFYSLAQYFALILFECCDADDYTPARILMNMCFTYCLQVTSPHLPYLTYNSHKKPSHKPEVSHENSSTSGQYYLVNILRDQPIWKSARFWNAAFFDAIQDERETYFFSGNGTSGCSVSSGYERQSSFDDWQFQANVTFGALATFTHNMHSFGLSQQFCLEFLQKQSTIANLTGEQVAMVRDNIQQLYHS